MATIKAIEARTIHQIQSGQVIVDLCSVVKELVENSVDAGATNIEVRFKNQGLDSIQIQDNGSGISPSNYETLALKHYTSKLSTYSDLTSLQTFGFRGEALSSLCALSKFSVTTCLAAEAPRGCRLEFETSGKLRGTSVVAAQKGTTVTIEGLFNNLPVRRRELERNIKREWNRVIGVLNQYACILTGMKFSVSQQSTKGKKVVLFSTKGNSTTRENIVNVFGAKTLTVLVPLDLELELETTSATSQRWSTQEDGGTKEIRVRGHVSRPAHGEGRQTPDRQMFFVNGRPCGLPQFAKVFNEVYKSYNSSQSPFILADIQLDTHMYDVNVSPDKRTILLHDQSRMLDNLRESLVALFEAQEYLVPISQLAIKKQLPFKKLAMSRQGIVESEGRTTAAPPTGNVGSSRDTESPVLQNDQGHGKDEKNSDQDATPAREGNVSARYLAQDGQGLNLISRWIERKSDDRDDPPAEVTMEALKGQGFETSGAKEKLISKLKHARENNESPAEDPNEDLASEYEQEKEKETPNRIRDFNAHLAELNKPNAADTSHGAHRQKDRSEPPIPAISIPSRVAQPPASSSFSSSRFNRKSPEVATITIGSETVTSVIGGPPPKKARLDKPKDQVRRSSDKSSAQVPSFQGRLTQMFAASSAAREKTAEVEVTTDLLDASDRSRSSSEELFVNEGDDDDRDEAGSTKEKELAGSHDADGVDGQDDASAVYAASDDEDNDRDASNVPSPAKSNDGEDDDDYVDENEKKAQEEDKVQTMIAAAEDAAKASSEETEKRQQNFFKGTIKRKDATRQLIQRLRLDEKHIRSMFDALEGNLAEATPVTEGKMSTDNLDAPDAEEKLSLTISKSDFGKMKIIGQFNIGFILAVRAAETNLDESEDQRAADDELFIIDQHATDEKYNFERLQASTVVQSQRLVQPKTLELTAIEEEVIKDNMEALENNGFMVSVDESGYQPVGSRCQLLALPLSRETTFSLADLDELISILTDHQATSENTMPRPSKVRKMFAMRACRSSVMIGRPLSNKQMEKLVRHMGELDKPWNCPHGRPTMRHLCGLGAWGDAGWQEGDSVDGERPGPTDWASYVRKKRDV